MNLKIDLRTCVVFDLDDTLYFEIDFLKSAFSYISKKLFSDCHDDIFNQMCKIWLINENVFEYLVENYPEKKLTLIGLLRLYRNHIPLINLRKGADVLLNDIIVKKGTIGLITDGRSKTQRNKIKALGLNKFLTEIIISEEFGSEKPSDKNYIYFMDKYPGYDFIYIGDNLEKDFVSPKKMGWFCIGLLNGELGIHNNSGIDLSEEYIPDVFVRSMEEIIIV